MPNWIRINEPNLDQKKLFGYPNLDLEKCLNGANFVFIAINHNEYKNSNEIINKINNDTVVIDIWNCLHKNKVSFTKKEYNL